MDWNTVNFLVRLFFVMIVWGTLSYVTALIFARAYRKTELDIRNAFVRITVFWAAVGIFMTFFVDETLNGLGIEILGAIITVVALINFERLYGTLVKQATKKSPEGRMRQSLVKLRQKRKKNRNGYPSA